MKKCAVCTIGSWTVGLSAVFLGVAAIVPQAKSLLLTETLLTPILILIGLTGLGLLWFQVKSCPACERANHIKR